MSLAPLSGYVCARRPSAGPNHPRPGALAKSAIHANPHRRAAARRWPLTCAGDRARATGFPALAR